MVTVPKIAPKLEYFQNFSYRTQKTSQDTPVEYPIAETTPRQLENVVSGAQCENGEISEEGDDATFDVFGTWEL